MVFGCLLTQVGYCNGTTDEPTYEEVCSGETVSWTEDRGMETGQAAPLVT